MAVDLFQKIDRSKVDKLPFLKEGSFAFGYKDSAGVKRLGIAYEINAENYAKLKKLLKGKEEREIKEKDRVFVLSGCKIPQFKIKEFCRSKGAVFTNDIQNATVFIGNDRFHDEDHAHLRYQNLNSTSMLIHTSYIEYSKMEPDEKYEIEACVSDYYPDLDELGSIRVMPSATDSGSYGAKEGVMRCICPYIAAVTYEILSRKIPTISEDYFLSQIPGVAVLDKELYESLDSMFASTDEQNHETAREILANCDWKSNELYLYLLARDYYYLLARSRYKNIRLFVEESDLRTLYSYTESGYIEHREKEGTLTKEVLEALLPAISKELIRTINHGVASPIFDFKMELKPVYSKILESDKFNQKVTSKSQLDESDEF